MQNERNGKAHTPGYLHLKGVAERLNADWRQVTEQGYGEQTVEDVLMSCARAWQDAIRYVTSPHGLKQPPGTVRAAQKRLRAKGLLTFLEAIETRKKPFVESSLRLVASR